MLTYNFFLGKYEGGLKIWECTKDLCDFLTDSLPIVENELKEPVFKIPGIVIEQEENTLIKSFKDKLCLDLGCGAGILGILCLQHEAMVHFQDYVSINQFTGHSKIVNRLTFYFRIKR